MAAILSRTSLVAAFGIQASSMVSSVEGRWPVVGEMGRSGFWGKGRVQGTCVPGVLRCCCSGEVMGCCICCNGEVMGCCSGDVMGCCSGDVIGWSGDVMGCCSGDVIGWCGVWELGKGDIAPEDTGIENWEFAPNS